MDLDRFFKIDICVKELLHGLAPMSSDTYSSEARFAYGERLYSSTNDFYYYFEIIMSILNCDEEIVSCVKSFLTSIRKRITDCNYDFTKLENCYNECFADMKEDTTKLIKETFADSDDVFVPLQSCTTINELLHLFHTYLLTQEKFYLQVPLICEKECSKGKIYLRGKFSEEGRALFDGFPNLNFDSTQVVTTYNPFKIVVFIKSDSSSLNLDISFDEDIVWISYHILGINDLDRIRKLPGIERLEDEDISARGLFMSDKKFFVKKINDFIEKVSFSKEENISQNLCSKSL